MKNARSSLALRWFAMLFVFTLCFPTLRLHATSPAELKSLFKNPPREYSTGPLWVWNDMLTEDQIRGTIRDLANQNVKQVWVHPRPGLMTPYLSADWFRLWKVSLEEAEKLDMNVWIYDENSYPSGFAGGWVPEVMPESRGRGLSLKEANSLPKWSDATVAVYRLSENGAENVSAKVKAGETFPEGRYLVASEVRSGNSPWHGNRSYVNLLSPGVTEKFLELTMEPYRKELGSQFGKRVPGVFTDEPNIRPAGGFPWSEILAAEFQKRWGYSLVDNLPSLAKPIGDWRKIRHDYFTVLNEQFIEHWAKPYYYYCETNHLQFTGHYWDHEWPDCIGVPDNMAMYAWHQLPSIDCLMNQYAEHTHAQFGNVRMVKELSSIANQLGRKHTLCEIYGAGGWDLRFEDMKRIGDWLEVLGVNILNQHLSYVTIRGARKRDHPQSFSYHAPWWEAYHVSADYLARVSAALAQGRQVNRVLVIQPTTTAWMYQGDGEKLKALGEAFFKTLMALEAAQVEYDLASEEVLGRYGSVQPASYAGPVLMGDAAQLSRSPKGLELVVGECTYNRVIIPPLTETLNSQTVKFLRRVVDQPGACEVICAGDVPSRMDGRESGEIASLQGKSSWKTLNPDQLVSALSPSLGTGPHAFDVVRAKGDQGILFHHRRELDGGEVLFLVNTSIEHPSSGTFQSGMGSVEKLDPYTGAVTSHPFEATYPGVRARFDLPPSGSLLLLLSEKRAKPVAPAREITQTIPPVSGPEIRRLEPNVLTLDYVDVTAGGETKQNTYFYQANQFAWQKNGMERNPWDSAVQFKDELITKTFPAGSGFEGSYKFRIEGGVPQDLAIVIERPDLYTISCNGTPIAAKPGDWWLDKAFGRISIAPHARTGENVVTIKASPFTMYHELEPAYLLGSFSLRPEASGFVVTDVQPLRLGNSPKDGWNAQGMPFYAAGVAYTQKFDLKKKRGTYFVSLPKWYGSVAKVTVNGKPAGYIDAPPWQAEVSKCLRAGENEIAVTVIGTPKNLLGPHHGNPVLGAAWPGNFQRGPNPGPPPGSQYSNVAYGLFEPFVLLRKAPEK